MKQRIIAFVIIVLVALAAYAVPEHRPPNAGLPVVNADYPMCITVKPEPLRPPKHDVFHPQADGELS